jgi:pimeloyl-ACP methyl ester carboxylesterase
MFTISRTPMARSRRTIAAGIAASAIALTALAGCATAADATDTKPTAAPTAAAIDPSKPTVVLVHGAWADATSFAGVEKELTADGYPVLSFANPLRSLSADSAYLATFLAARTTGPVILVGHSYGGAVISSAALSDPDVRGLVYIDGFVPDEGESLASLQADTPSDPTTTFDFAPYPGAADGDVDLYLKKEVFGIGFANGLTPAEQTSLYAAQRPIAISAINETAVGTPAWKSLPSWYVAGTEDHSVSIELQRTMAERAGSDITELKTGHLSMVQEPSAVAKVIEKASDATK